LDTHYPNLKSARGPRTSSSGFLNAALVGSTTMPRPARLSSPPATLAPLRALTASPAGGGTLLRRRALLRATSADSGVQRTAALFGSTGAERPCVY
jgi:hypothetical protein